MADKTPQELQDERLQALETKIGTQDKIISNLQKENERVKGLETRMGAQDKTIAVLQKENASLTAMLKKSAAKDPAPEELPKLPETTFDVDGKKYKFIVPVFRHKGERVTAFDALQDLEILAELVEKNSGLIQQIH